MVLNVNSDDFVESIKRHHTGSLGQKAVYFYRYGLPQGGEAYRLTFAAPEMHLLITTDLLVEARQSFNIYTGQPTRTGDANFDQLVSQLQGLGMLLAKGLWTDTGASGAQEGVSSGGNQNAPADLGMGNFSIGAVAYMTADNEAGIWVDAFPDTVSEEQVLQAMYREFVNNGDLVNTSYDEFINASQPTVEVDSSEDVTRWLTQKGG